MATVEDCRKLLKMEGLQDIDIEPHLSRGVRDLGTDEFASPEDETEAIACKTIYYLAPLLWSVIQSRVNEYDETMTSYRDIEAFQDYWDARSSSVPRINSVSGSSTMRWAAV